MSKVRIDYYETRCDCCNAVIGKATSSRGSPSYDVNIGKKKFIVIFYQASDDTDEMAALDICEKCRAAAVIECGEEPPPV